MQTVCYTVPVLHHYRVGFHQRVREELQEHGVEYRLIYSPAAGADAAKSDTVDLPWAEMVPANILRFRGREAYWQHLWKRSYGADLTILAQWNRLLANYLIQMKAYATGQKVAFFGHGKNFQSAAPNGARERWKRYWATRVDWWFTYTERCADLIEGYGFAREKITVFNNSIDLSQIAQERAELEPKIQEELRHELVSGSHNVGVYVGAMYTEKRIAFLLETATKIRTLVPDFHLLFIGAGPDEHLVQAAANAHSWIRYVGPKFGQEKTNLVSLAKICLMPGLVGLGVLDSFAYETPMITTNHEFHSPEVDYLEDGLNGIMLEHPDGADAYAAAAQRLLTNEPARAVLIAGARVAREKYSIEKMADRFAKGTLAALASR